MYVCKLIRESILSGCISQVLWKVDTILFSLIVLRGLCDNQGRVWRCYPHQLYAVEVTLPNRDVAQHDPESCTLALLDLLPFVTCLSPRAAMESPEQKGMLQGC